MSLSLTLKTVLKRGALVAAANWPVAVIQATADSLFKLLVATPVVGGVFLVALVVGAEPDELMSLDWHQLATTIASSLLVRPAVLVAWVGAVLVVVVGGSLLVFLVKGGTVGVLVAGERHAGPIEQPPLLPETVSRASAFSIEAFIASARGNFQRYARLGVALMVMYLASGAAYLLLLARTAGGGWGMPALGTALFVAWITLVNLYYLLTQIAIATDDCSVLVGASRVALFLRRQLKGITGVFLVVLGLVTLASVASVLATAALWLVGFVPFVGLTVLPLQLLAWVLRTLVFQFIGLGSIGAYVRLYRAESPENAVRELYAAEVS